MISVKDSAAVYLDMYTSLVAMPLTALWPGALRPREDGERPWSSDTVAKVRREQAQRQAWRN